MPHLMSELTVPFLQSLGIDTRHVRSWRLDAEPNSLVTLTVEMYVEGNTIHALQRMFKTYVLQEAAPTQKHKWVEHYTRMKECSGGIGGGGGGDQCTEITTFEYICEVCLTRRSFPTDNDACPGRVPCPKCGSSQCEEMDGRACRFFAKARANFEEAQADRGRTELEF